MAKRVVVVTPTYNERDNVAAVVETLAKVFKSLKNYHPYLLFVDDNSPDGTGTAIAKLASTYPFVRLFKNKRKAGLGHAYKKGFAYAIAKLNADILVQFDADLSHDATKLPAMLEKIERGADLVLGARYLPGGGIPENWPLYRKFLSITGNLFIRFVMLNSFVHDWTTGYRVITREVVEAILPNLQNSAFNGYTYNIGFLVKSLQNGYKVSEVPFYFKDRTLGNSKLGTEYIFNTLRFIMKVRISQIINHRIFKFVMVGGFGSLVQLVALSLFRQVFRTDYPWLSAYQISLILAIETAIVSNFTWNNLWTFSDRKLKAGQIPGKFLQFNLASGGSIIIQFVIATLGEKLIGLFDLFRLPFTSFMIDTGLIYAMLGILIGMFWNFFAYNRLIWKKQ